MDLRKDLFKVFGSNVITLAVGIVSGLVIPSFLSLDQYAYFKTFTLYLGYVGILHFGLADGLFIKYGGSYEDEVDKSLLKGEHHFFLVFQFIISIAIIITSFFIDDKILLAFSLSIIPFNLLTFYKFFYQAIGKFDIYSKILIFPPIVMLIANLAVIFIFKIENYWLFIIIRLFAYTSIFLILEYNFYKLTKSVDTTVDFEEIKSIFNIGFFIMLGNLSSIAFYSIDRWFVKLALTTSDFAFYSFAMSMMAMINIFINSITKVFYPYLSRNSNDKILQKLKSYFIIIASFASSSYFLFSFIVNNFIPKHIPALNIIAIIFAGFPALITIKALYVNLYKVRKSDKLYVKTVFSMLLISVILNFIALTVFGNNIAIAIATTISFYIWFYFSSRHFETLFVSLKEVLYLVIFVVLFIYSSNLVSLLVGTIVFSVGLLILVFGFYKSEFMGLINEFKNKGDL
ncbi:O-antigen/teichoic acid export membrane protein [Halanaerobium congolense]|uniref:O-antigen/teichoic acid export membrane protein n=1 Tax=Halanaerobium congolense TaxID=54121 RepID=A0A4R8GNP6_9FIRM|nr:oligosaccharide flippase family protein [Halanaerobium congolense]TDX43663.1 O-antigen/teichoic acid export membrane protein [Halanaerobium congolense]